MLKVTVNQQSVYEIDSTSEGLTVNQQPVSWDLVEVRANSFHILHNNKSYNAEVIKADYETKTFTIRINSRQYQLNVKDRFDLLLEQMGMSQANTAKINQMKAPMPGLILDVKVQPGDTVKKGDPLLILEAMKMENVIKSPGDGAVKLVKVKKGDHVEKNQVLIEF